MAQQSKKTMRATGRVTAVAADAITIKPGNDTLTLSVDTSTNVTGKGVGTRTRSLKAGNKALQVTDLVDVNDSVVVEYHDLDGRKLHAVQISIRVKAFKKS